MSENFKKILIKTTIFYLFGIFLSSKMVIEFFTLKSDQNVFTLKSDSKIVIAVKLFLGSKKNWVVSKKWFQNYCKTLS